MSALDISIPHALSQDEALQRVKDGIVKGKAEYASRVRELHEHWDGYLGTFSAIAMGYALSATMTVNPDAVLVHAQLPAVASFFRGAIEKAVREHLDSLLRA
jgi:Putative polyhydroxyalkanoic acid system protein (PHA_gran_rgn)